MSDSLLRELDYREHDGIAVTLLWSPSSNEVSVQVIDTRDGTHFRAAVPAGSALDAFRHPYVYEASSLPLAMRGQDQAVAT
jgi:hypothetical protein